MEKSHVIKPESGGYRLTDGRVSLDSIVCDWWIAKPWVRIASSVQSRALDALIGSRRP